MRSKIEALINEQQKRLNAIHSDLESGIYDCIPDINGDTTVSMTCPGIIVIDTKTVDAAYLICSAVEKNKWNGESFCVDGDRITGVYEKGNTTLIVLGPKLNEETTNFTKWYRGSMI